MSGTGAGDSRPPGILAPCRARLVSRTRGAIIGPMRYDPTKPPDPGSWLAQDETERAAAVQRYHRDARIKLPGGGARMHALLHVIVENQLAGRVEAVVRAMTRLQGEGLSRHDALHAVASVLAANLYDLLNGEHVPDNPQASYEEELATLTARKWRDEYGQQ